MSYRFALFAIASAFTVLGCSAPQNPKLIPPDAPRLDRASDPIAALAPPPDDHHERPPRECFGGRQAEIAYESDQELILQRPYSGSFADGFAAIAAAPWGALTRFVLADRGRGVRVLDATDRAREPRLTASFPIPSPPIDLRVAGEHALLTLTGQGGRGYELLSLKLHDDAAPELVQRLSLPGSLLRTHALPGTAERPRFALIVGVPDSKRCGDANRTLVRVLEWREGRIELIQELDLGADVIRMERSGAWFAILDMHGPEGRGSGYGLRFLDLSASTLAVSKRRPATSMLRGFTAYGSALHVVSAERVTLEPPNSMTMREQFSIEQLRVTPKLEVQLTKRCSLETRAVPADVSYQDPEPPQVNEAILLRDRTVITFIEPHVAQSVEHASCKVEPLKLAGDHFMVTPDGAHLIALGPADKPFLDVAMHDVAQLGAPPIRAHVELAKPKLRGDSIARDWNHYWMRNPTWHVGGKRLLLSVLFQQYDLQGDYTFGTQLFDIERDAIHARAPQATALWLTRPDGSAVYRDDLGLTLTQIDDAPSSTGTRLLWPRYLNAKLLDDPRPLGAPRGLARVRYPSTAQRYDPHTDAQFAALEFVPGDQDAQSERPSRSFEISGNAKLHTVGRLLIAASQYIARDEDGPVPCHITVFDTAAGGGPDKLSAQIESQLCDRAHALTDQPALSTPHALVFARTESQRKTPHEISAQRLAFFALDLRNPKQPALLAPFRTPADEYALAAFGDGTRVVYAFRVAVPAADPTQPIARFYVRFVDFSDPSTPRMAEPIAVPGEPIALEGDVLYTLHAKWVGPEKAEHTVHKLKLQSGAAQIIESGLDLHDVYSRFRTAAVEEDDEVIDATADELLLLKQGTLRRVRRR